MRLEALALNPYSRKLIESYCLRPTQSLLLTGRPGSGLRTLADSVALHLAKHATDTTLVTPNEKGTITIEQVRLLYVDTRDVRASRQFVIVDDMDAMSFDAQNAFLKLLEEPNENVHFILTSHQPEALLPTILSRVQHIELRPVDQTASQTIVAQYKPVTDTAAKQALFIAAGRPAELTRLMTDTEYFEKQAGLVRLAKDFLSGNTYERLSCIAKISTRQDALIFLRLLVTIIHTLGRREKSLLKTAVAETIEQAAERITANGHIRTQLLNLALHV